MSAMKELFQRRDDAGKCVLCGKPDPDTDFYSGRAHSDCATIYNHDLAEWQRDQAEQALTEAESRMDEVFNRGER